MFFPINMHSRVLVGTKIYFGCDFRYGNRSLPPLCQIFCFVFQSHALSQFKSSDVDIILYCYSKNIVYLAKYTFSNRNAFEIKCETNWKISRDYLIFGDITI